MKNQKKKHNPVNDFYIFLLFSIIYKISQYSSILFITTSIRTWMTGLSRSRNHGVESVDLIGLVLNCTGGTIGFLERVKTFHDITISFLLLLFLITSVWVVNFIVEIVFRISLSVK